MKGAGDSLDEQEFVAGQFQKAFEAYKHKPFVLYGLGKNTEAVLDHTEGFRFAGLMDAQNTGKMFFGKKVLSEEEVLALRPVIVIIAREPVVPVIYERIAHLQKDFGLSIYDFKGELQGRKTAYSNQDLPYWDVAEEDAKQAIDAHDAISFDIFDTLLMRRVPEPTDVFCIVERILEKRGHEGNDFRERRIQAERALAGYPALDQIYEAYGRLYGCPDEMLSCYRQLELEVEGQVIAPRKTMVGLFRYALEQGKQVWLISDMYLGREEMQELLGRCGIEGYHGLLISCEHQKSKEDGGLFDVYRQLIKKGSRCLHIGDNRRSDGERAREKGLDTFLICSGYEMWMMSSMQCTLAHVETPEQRCILGNLIWKTCEDPFALHETKGMLAVKKPEDLGYLFLGPLYDAFIAWLLDEMEKESQNIRQLLLPARDGFFVEKLLAQEGELPFEMVYFKASRRAVSVPAIRTDEDIMLLAGRGFQGSYGELLFRRFGIRARDDDGKKGCMAKGGAPEQLQEYALSYRDEIFRRAQQERGEYLSYLEEKGILKGEDGVAIFDFAAGGTVQFFLQKLLGKRLKGLYFATMNHPNPSYGLADDIVSAYGNITSYGAASQVAKHYLFLEAVMVDGCPTFRCIEEGNFVYDNADGVGQAGQTLPDSVQRVQEGILQYRQDMGRMREIRRQGRGGDAERAFADRLFGRLFDGSCEIRPGVLGGFVNDDIFDGIPDYPLKEGMP